MFLSGDCGDEKKPPSLRKKSVQAAESARISAGRWGIGDYVYASVVQKILTPDTMVQFLNPGTPLNFLSVLTLAFSAAFIAVLSVFSLRKQNMEIIVKWTCESLQTCLRL